MEKINGFGTKKNIIRNLMLY